MKEKPKSELVTCRVCGKANPTSNSFCHGCGVRLSPPGENRRKPYRSASMAIIAAVVAVLILGGGITAAVVLLARTPSIKLPTTREELVSSIGQTEKYLKGDMKSTARARTRGASIYSVDAKLDTKNATVSGDVIVLYTNHSGDVLDRVVFRVYANSDEVRGEGKPVVIEGTTVDGTTASAGLNGTLLEVRLPNNLQPGKSAMVELSFLEYLPQLESGISTLLGGEDGGYGLFGRSENTYNLGYFMPMIASYRNGSWDTRQPQLFGDILDFDFAHFNVSIDVPGDFLVAATGMPTGEKSGGGRKVFSFAAGPVRDFGIQASRDFKVMRKAIGSTLVSSYYLENSSGAGGRVLNFTCDALNQFSRHFGEYPFTRLNVCQSTLSGGAAGMEFSGHVMLAQLLYGDLDLGGMLDEEKGKVPEEYKDLGGKLGDLLGNITGDLLGDTLEFVTAHEVCHQWWGMGVGSDSIENPWQDEALTNYCSVLYFRWQHGEEAARKALQQDLSMQYSAARMMGAKDAVAESPLDAFDSDEQYAAVVYAKGGLFFEALEKLIGPKAFEKSLREYYDGYVFMYATPEALMEAFEDNGSDPRAVQALYRHWMQEVHGDEDIDMPIPMIPGMENLQDLLDDLLKDGELDLGPLEDQLEDLFDQEGETLPEEEPSTII